MSGLCRIHHKPTDHITNCEVCEVKVVKPAGTRGRTRTRCDSHKTWQKLVCGFCNELGWATYKSKRCKKCVDAGRTGFTRKLCKEADCNITRHAKGYCKSHYQKRFVSQNHSKTVRSTRPVVCRGCKEIFQCSTKNANIYCSRKCAMAYRKPWNLGSKTPRKQNLAVFFTCEWCNEEFQSANRKKFCSIECRRENSILNGLRNVGLSLNEAMNKAIREHDYETILKNVAERVVRINDCWVWPQLDKEGYARHNSLAMHRIVLEAKHQAPLGSQAAHHVCANKACVNPDHLQPVTYAQNTAEMLARNAYIKRIAELEQALAGIDANHPALNRVPLAS